MNIGLLLEVRERILANPEQYDQGSFCGTACCIAGHAVLAAGHILKPGTVKDSATRLIGGQPDSVKRLFGFFWPDEFYARLGRPGTLEHAQAAADAIIDFIITDGWTKDADPSKLVLASQAAAPETTAELVAHP